MTKRKPFIGANLKKQLAKTEFFPNTVASLDEIEAGRTAIRELKALEWIFREAMDGNLDDAIKMFDDECKADDEFFRIVEDTFCYHVCELVERSGCERFDGLCYLFSADGATLDQRDWSEEDRLKDFDFNAAPMWLVPTGETDAEPCPIWSPEDLARIYRGEEA